MAFQGATLILKIIFIASIFASMQSISSHLGFSQIVMAYVFFGSSKA